MKRAKIHHSCFFEFAKSPSARIERTMRKLGISRDIVPELVEVVEIIERVLKITE